ncbi:MAG: hypothetical protein GWO02_10495 [Gammaproteobacteria bacterium]|nr:hypothetical protein [Gammaproteobacteria bacterium]
MHLLTLGFMTMVMLGALLQLLAVVARAPVPRVQRLAALAHGALTLGTAAFAAGLALNIGPLLVAGLGGLLGALVPFVIAAAGAAVRSPLRHPAVGGMRWALAALAVTVLLGVAATGRHTGMALAGPWLSEVHLAWGLVGWTGLLVMGVAQQVVPMLHGTPAYPEWAGRALVPAGGLALLAWSLAAALGVDAARTGTGLVGAAVLACFAVLTLARLVRRRRAATDASIYYWWLGMGALLGCVVLWAVRQAGAWPGAPERLDAPIAALYIVGFAVSLISGMLYRIVPFLVWLHLQRARGWPTPWARRSPMPNMMVLIPPRAMAGQFTAHALGVALTLPATLRPGAWAYAAALILAGAWLGLALNLIGAVRRGRAAGAAIGARGASSA